MPALIGKLLVVQESIKGWWQLKFHLIVFPSEEDRAWFVFLTNHIFSGVHYESYIFQAVSKLILCWHISKLAKFLLRLRWGVQNERKVHRQEHDFIKHLRRENLREKWPFVKSLMLSSFYFKTLLFIAVVAWWELMAGYMATFCSVPFSDSTSKQVTHSDGSSAHPEPWDTESTDNSFIQVSYSLMNNWAKIHTPWLGTRLGSFVIHHLLIPDPNWFVGWFTQQMFSEGIPYTEHATKGQGTDKGDKDVALSSKEARLLLSLGFMVRPRGCSMSLFL